MQGLDNADIRIEFDKGYSFEEVERVSAKLYKMGFTLVITKR